MAKILAVDDSASIRRIMVSTLRGAGHEVVDAADGLEALHIAKTQTGFDLLISDINMPNMDGVALFKALRLMPAYESIPILILTNADTGPEHRVTNVSGWLVKPVNPEYLLEMVGNILGL